MSKEILLELGAISNETKGPVTDIELSEEEFSCTGNYDPNQPWEC